MRRRGQGAAKVVRDHGLSLVLAALFAVFLVGQSLTGLAVYNDEQRDHGQAEIGYVAYLTSGHFIEATFENWESEFLQMGAYLVLTVFLFQRGSAESHDPDRPPRRARRTRSIRQWLYANSLALAFLALFLGSFALHAVGGAAQYSREQQAHGAPAVSPIAFLGTSTFWFQSFQNWQSEFLAILAMVVLTIFLRQEGSPESKPVSAPHSQTGKEG